MHCRLSFESFLLCSFCVYPLSFSLFVSTIMAPLVPPSNFKWKIFFGSYVPFLVTTFSHNFIVVKIVIATFPLFHLNFLSKRNLLTKRNMKPV